MLAKLAAVRSADHPGAGLVFAKHCLHRIGYFTNRTPKEKKNRLPQYVFYIQM